jgi:hypothetical protein
MKCYNLFVGLRWNALIIYSQMHWRMRMSVRPLADSRRKFNITNFDFQENWYTSCYCSLCVQVCSNMAVMLTCEVEAALSPLDIQPWGLLGTDF